ARRLSRDDCPEGLRYHRAPFRGARRAAADQGWRAGEAGRRGAEGACADSRGELVMTRMVQVSIAGDVTEAEELQAILRQAGIESELETAVDHHPSANDDVPQTVLVPEPSPAAAH